MLMLGYGTRGRGGTCVWVGRRWHARRLVVIEMCELVTAGIDHRLIYAGGARAIVVRKIDLERV